MRQLTEQNMQQLLDQYEGVVYSAMKKVGIYKRHPSFDDFYQIGCIKLFEAYETCEKDPLLEEHRHQFVYYASQRLQWAFLDEMRRDKKRFEKEEWQSDEQIMSFSLPNEFEENMFLKEQLYYLLALLSPNEYAFLYDRFCLNLSVTKIATKHGVSRKTVYQWRKKLQEKARFLMEG
ncbi:sigma-70 family RNA polymerase sigma factor [Jeotgalibaca ciconiae]|uniref:Sigma-70 family RNA polymerase sigma factor n=1 Tax=Jeotgalibaca ciconiae TaxID=2496265 RepID=A0A3S9HC66_9LACT|nr:sigma-70 family RNA polymerase sigma factor [Jeotgalibaca ciconiae]AZP04965.1 sigma-70 family RNA polymerase sigma factor [Jeotgalibaca ciconiae]